jgi:hypothetical protein
MDQLPKEIIQQIAYWALLGPNRTNLMTLLSTNRAFLAATKALLRSNEAIDVLSLIIRQGVFYSRKEAFIYKILEYQGPKIMAIGAIKDQMKHNSYLWDAKWGIMRNRLLITRIEIEGPDRVAKWLSYYLNYYECDTMAIVGLLLADIGRFDVIRLILGPQYGRHFQHQVTAYDVLNTILGISGALEAPDDYFSSINNIQYTDDHNIFILIKLIDLHKPSVLRPFLDRYYYHNSFMINLAMYGAFNSIEYINEKVRNHNCLFLKEIWARGHWPRDRIPSTIRGRSGETLSCEPDQK